MSAVCPATGRRHRWVAGQVVPDGEQLTRTHRCADCERVRVRRWTPTALPPERSPASRRRQDTRDYAARVALAAQARQQPTRHPGLTGRLSVSSG